MPKKDVPFIHSFIAGNIAGVCGLSASYPFDTVKIRLQTHPGVYRGLLDCFRKMLLEEGFFAFYRGLLSPACGYGAINAVAFSTNSHVVQYLAPDGKERVIHNVYGGTAAGATSGLVRAPIERIKTIMQHARRPDGTSPYRGSVHCIVETWKANGFRSIMAGTYSTMIREMMQYAAYYPSYAIAKKLLTYEGEKQPSKLRIALSGAIAGMVQWLPPSYCVDVVKSRIQAEPAGTYKGMADCARQAFARDGWFVFFRGLTPALVRAVPMHGTIFLVYEVVLEKISNR